MIHDKWNEFQSLILPKNVSKVQLTETRRAFYAGAEACLRTMLEFLDPGTEPTDNDLAKMDALNNELIEFGLSIGTPQEHMDRRPT